jgi:DNA repair exonuclease SbcCD ATPase subunit
MTEIIKVKKLLKLDAGMLGQLKEVELTLASEEAKKLESAVPEGHPLKAEIEKQKAMLGGDLSGLPTGHPLIRALQTAKEAYEVRQAEEAKNKGEGKPAEAAKQDEAQVRKAKRLEEVKARQARFTKEEQESDDTRAASKEVNRKVDEILSTVKEAWQTLAGSEEILSRTPINRARVMRLKRLLFAAERGLSETRLGRI